MLTSDDLKSLRTYLKQAADEALAIEPPDSEGAERLIKISRQIEVIRYNPLIFQDIIEEYDVDYAVVMEKPVDDLPMYINEAGILSKTLVKWRLSNNV
jgi:hypothetical protein